MAKGLLWAWQIPQTHIDAEDLVQDVGASMYRKWDTISHPKAYLRGSIFNKVKNYNERERGKYEAVGGRLEVTAGPQALSQMADERVAAAAPGASPMETGVIRVELASDLSREWANLPDRQKRCVALRAQGVSYKDIAARDGVAPGTVSTHRDRGLARLRQRLVDLGYDRADVLSLLGVAALVVVLVFTASVALKALSSASIQQWADVPIFLVAAAQLVRYAVSMISRRLKARVDVRRRKRRRKARVAGRGRRRRVRGDGSRGGRDRRRN